MKKRKKIYFRLFACFIVGIQFFSISTITSFADEIQENTVTNEIVEQAGNSLAEEATDEPLIENEVTENAFMEADEKVTPKYELKPILNEERYVLEELIPVQFDRTDVVSYTYEAEGIAVTEKAPNSMQFDIIPTAEVGCINVYADYGTGELIESSVYTYLNEGQVYISDISKDQAWYNCMEEKYNSGLITMEEWEDSYSDLTRKYSWGEGSFITTRMPSSEEVALLNTSTGDTYAKVKLEWEYATNKKLPLKHTKVELLDEEVAGFSVLAEGYTDENGECSFSFENEDELLDFENGGCDLTIRAYSESYTFTIAADWLISQTYVTSEVVDNVETGSVTTLYGYVIYNTGLVANDSFYVQQAMVLGQQFATEMGMETDYFLNVIYPAAGLFPTTAGFCWGDLAENCYALIGQKAFDCFDLVIHEYGHFVQNAMGIYGATLLDMLLYDPEHLDRQADLFEEKDSSEYAMNLVWSEAWATVFSQIAQEYYRGEYNYVPDFADQRHGTWSVESVSTNINSGEAQEAAVTAFLWDIYDGYNATETFDNSALDFWTWWEYTTRAGIYTLTDFMEAIDMYSPQIRGKIGAILAYYQIAPSLIITNLSSVNAMTAPRLEWKNHGSVNNPNDFFKIAFYNTNWECVYMTGEIPAASTNHRDKTSYNIPTAFWIEWVRTYGGVCNIRIAVLGFHTEPIDEDTSLISGPYFSEIHLITITAPSVVRSFNANTKYMEQIIRLESGFSYTYKVIFSVQETMLIQTFGPKNTLIYIFDKNNVLKASNDNGGYSQNALIKFVPTADMEYHIRVQFYGSTSGQTKLTITCANGAKKTESESLSTYDDILTITTNVKTYTWNTYAQKNRARVIRFVQQTSGYYSFSIESDFDTYLFVIDPRSNEGKVLYVDYDDDSGEGDNASVIRYLQAGVPYYVVYSAYAPSELTETKNLSLVITRLLP